MIIERIIFNILAFTLFILMFAKMISKNDTNYIAIIAFQALGIAISFFETVLGQTLWIGLKILTYALSIILPFAIIYFDFKNINLVEQMYAIIAKILFHLGNRKKAKQILVDIVTKYPESYKGHKYLAELYEREGGMRRAIDEYVKAIDIHKNDYDSYYKIAELLNGLTQKEQAVTMLNNLLRIKPDYYKASNLLGDLLIEEKKYKEAANIYLDALKYRPADYEIYYNLGIAYTMLNDFPSAEEAYKKAAQINHLKYNTDYTLAQIALICDEEEKAEQYFNEALYGEEVEHLAYYELAKISMRKGQKDKAIAFLNKALEIEPKLKEKMDKEQIFIPIKTYIVINEENENEKKDRKKLGKREMAVLRHLEETLEKVQKLNNRRDYFRGIKQKNKDKELKNTQEKEKYN